MTTRPQPERWRPTWARLAIVHEPDVERYKLYAVEESNMNEKVEQRTAAERQPQNGFATLDEAQTALAEADAAAELARLRSRGGTLAPAPNEAEVESVRACGDPGLRASKANPGGLPKDLETAFHALSDAITGRRRPGAALRITIGPDGTSEFLLAGGHRPDDAIETLPTATCRAFMDQALGNVGMTAEELLRRLEKEALPSKRATKTPARTLWNEPALVVCGAPEVIVNALRELQTDEPGKAEREEGSP